MVPLLFGLVPRVDDRADDRAHNLEVGGVRGEPDGLVLWVVALELEFDGVGRSSSPIWVTRFPRPVGRRGGVYPFESRRCAGVRRPDRWCRTLSDRTFEGDFVADLGDHDFPVPWVGVGELSTRYSHTTPSPSPSRMYRYAGCDRRTGAIPCRRASLHQIRPSRLSS